ncbi:MAG: 3-hydroxybutyryl-CoA dehydrogenase [Myxococcales bacterium]|nr:3-hydroxybutyryl-CoA dehydrogenase [Myxococcales bacterium]
MSADLAQIKVIGVLGAGQMGAGIAQVAATVGYQVLMADMNLEQANKGKAGIDKILTRNVSKERITEADKATILSRLTPVNGLSDLCGADFVIEAATENEALKLKLFAQLDEHCAPHAILATNTSSIPITRIAAATNRPHKVIGMHFMNPVPIMKLVEIITGLATDEDTHQLTEALAAKMGKDTVLARDMPGFIVNRILMPMINEAVTALYEGIGSREDIDAGMKLGTNQPMGPLTLADFIGLDTCLAIMEVLHEGMGDSKYRPCPLLKQYVDAGWLGRKSGRGFYEY